MKLDRGWYRISEVATLSGRSKKMTRKLLRSANVPLARVGNADVVMRDDLRRVLKLDDLEVVTTGERDRIGLRVTALERQVAGLIEAIETALSIRVAS